MSVERAMRDISQAWSQQNNEFQQIRETVQGYDGLLQNLQRVVDQDHEEIGRIKTTLENHIPKMHKDVADLTEGITQAQAAIDMVFNSMHRTNERIDRSEKEIRDKVQMMDNLINDCHQRLQAAPPTPPPATWNSFFDAGCYAASDLSHCHWWSTSSC